MARRTASNGWRRGLLLGATLSACLSANTARAQSADDTARAQALFDEGRALMKQSDYANACPKLAESQRLDPGGGTLLNLGICHELEGRTATAFAELKQALTQAKADARADRERTAQKHIDALAPALSHLTLTVGSDASTLGLLVVLDGAALDPARLGAPIAVDPGPHQLQASKPGYKPWSASIAVSAPHDEQTLAIPALEAEAASASPATPGTVESRAGVPHANGADSGVLRGGAPPDVDHRLPRWLGIATLGFGTAAIGVGTYFGIRTITLKSDSNQNYDGSKCTTQTCADDWSRARTASIYSDVAFGVGLAALGVGAYLVLAPSKHASAAQLPALVVAGGPAGATVSARTVF